MALAIGTQLGSHEITALLGKGGLGEVYRARDLNLKRDRDGRGHQLTSSVGRGRLGQVLYTVSSKPRKARIAPSS